MTELKQIQQKIRLLNTIKKAVTSQRPKAKLNNREYEQINNWLKTSTTHTITSIINHDLDTLTLLAEQLREEIETYINDCNNIIFDAIKIKKDKRK